MSRVRDASLFVALALLWGGGFTAIEVGLREVPPVLLAAYRFDVAALTVFAGLAVVERGRLPVARTRGDWAAVAVSATLLITANVVLLFFGQTYTTGAIAAVVYSLNPVLTAGFVSLLLPGGDFGVRDAVGVGLGIVGVGLVATPEPGSVVAADAIGVGLVFLAVVAVALGSVVLRRIDATLAGTRLTGWAMAGAAVELHGVSLLVGEPVALPTVPSTLGALAFLGVGGSAAAYSIYFALLGRRGPFAVNLVSYVVPGVAAVTGWLLLGEELGALAVAGFACVVVGFAVVERKALAAELGRLRATR
ncbi:MAG: DMT family transporter [Halolamina sp.]